LKDFDYIPAPRLFKIFMILKEEGLEPKVIQLGLRLIADDQDLINCIEDYKEKSSFFSEIPSTQYEILHEEIGIGYSGYCHDVFVAGMRALGEPVKVVSTTNMFMEAIDDL